MAVQLTQTTIVGLQADIDEHKGRTYVEPEATSAFTVTGADGTTMTFNPATASIDDLYNIVANLLSALETKKVI